MTPDKRYGGLDRFKLLASFLVVAIHTSPLASFSPEADFLLTRVAARVAVPFFLMVSGFFILPAYLFERSADSRAPLRFLGRAALLYLAAAGIYLPVGVYAGQYAGIGPLSILCRIVFDGTFYHLWYLPALIVGILLVYGLSRRLPFGGVLAVSLVLYAAGLFGDSYYGVIENLPGISSVYAAGFRVFSYTRNGIFYAPVFLAMGAGFGRSPRFFPKKAAAVCFSACMALMAAEGLILHRFGLQRHDSMYAMLPLCMLFLFPLVLSWRAEPSFFLRKVSQWVYILHPLCIVAVRGVSKLASLTDVLVGNSLVHYAAVCSLSFLLSACVAKLPVCAGKKDSQTGRAWIELDRDALRHNVAVLRSLLPPGCRLMPAVKADAYGHGAVLISRELSEMGVDAFCVASVREGVELRKKGIKGEILILGYTCPEQFCLLRRYRLTQSVLDFAYAQILDGCGKKTRVHVAVDTGMHRLGERCERLDEIIRIFQCKNLKIEGIFTHLCADDTRSPEDEAFTLAQGQAFRDIVSQLKERGFACPGPHLLASSGLLNYPELSGEYARVGIALYGMMSTRAGTESSSVSLRPVLSVKARIALVKDLYEGESAGYGLRFVARRDTQIAVLAVGYADGLPRALSCGVGRVLINGCEAPIVGPVCMDQTLVDVTGIPDVRPGGVAVIIGRSRSSVITACDLAEQAGTISNEILSRLGKRLERKMIAGTAR
ncbi:serine racemase VanT catalytic subunit [Papillibacter cinnamivorans]|uniref:Alanine racemase n=1 Tax=Papillibacter cinnamivorans DSM 12816 TaxID=1122930 RepID=A0A1W2BEU1_9FIRM|nr:serine racemase VanT catalytic subunit [Papillibacter cinnamivorans]SMC71439.1 serine/alanine racemase [Papillibacter cinnamivorans DSM 12816]